MERAYRNAVDATVEHIFENVPVSAYVDWENEVVRLEGTESDFRELGQWLFTIMDGYLGTYYSNLEDYMENEGVGLSQAIDNLFDWAFAYHEVFGGPSPSRVFEREYERYTRYL